jgi:hypothetical protein
MNDNNSLLLKRGTYVRIMDLKDGKTVMLPCVERIANGRVLNARQDGSSDVHWKLNYNTDGDFRSELMSFNSDLVMDVADEDARNEFRVSAGLAPLQ